jgi:hypothetical protein
LYTGYAVNDNIKVAVHKPCLDVKKISFMKNSSNTCAKRNSLNQKGFILFK